MVLAARRTFSRGDVDPHCFHALGCWVSQVLLRFRRIQYYNKLSGCDVRAADGQFGGTVVKKIHCYILPLSPAPMPVRCGYRRPQMHHTEQRIDIAVLQTSPFSLRHRHPRNQPIINCRHADGAAFPCASSRRLSVPDCAAPHHVLTRVSTYIFLSSPSTPGSLQSISPSFLIMHILSSTSIQKHLIHHIFFSYKNALHFVIPLPSHIPPSISLYLPLTTVNQTVLLAAVWRASEKRRKMG